MNTTGDVKVIFVSSTVLLRFMFICIFLFQLKETSVSTVGYRPLQ